MHCSHTHTTTPDSARRGPRGPPPTARIFIGSSGHLSFVLRPHKLQLQALVSPTTTAQRNRVSSLLRDGQSRFLLHPLRFPPQQAPGSSRVRSSSLCAAPRPDQAKRIGIGRTNGAARSTSIRSDSQREQVRPEQQAHRPVMSTSSTNSVAASPAVSGLDYDDTALTLALPGSSSSSAADPAAAADRKRAHADHDKPPPSPKARAVGWPPVRAYRRNALGGDEQANKLVKVAVDGAPYLRKVDLAAHDGYAALLRALHGMFASCLGAGADGAGRLVDAATGGEYVPTYEDKDGDWMLVGDVPFKMFVESCKRIRLMKSSEAINLSTRTSS